MLWFNSAVLLHASVVRSNPYWKEIFKEWSDDKLPVSTFYGDGSTMEPEVVQHVRDVIWKAGVGFQMNKNEVIALDNQYVQHGRLSFEGQRRMLASLLKF